VVNPPRRADGERIAARLGLEPLPREGGLFRRTHADAHCSTIYFLLLAPDFSAMHALACTEAYHWYAGAPLRLLLLHADGGISEPVLGPDLGRGEQLQFVVSAGSWQGSSPLGAWSLLGATSAPPFDWSGFRLGDRAALIERYPVARRRIESLTRDSDEADR
jgi:predicted cupin superfamily sugar epimerase